MIAYLPLVFVAIVIVVIAAAIAAGAKNLIQNSLGGLSYAGVLANLASGFILAIGVIAALDQLHIAANAANAVLYAVLAALVGIAIVAVGGIKTMSRRWKRPRPRTTRRSRRSPRLPATPRASPTKPASTPATATRPLVPPGLTPSDRTTPAVTELPGRCQVPAAPLPQPKEIFGRTKARPACSAANSRPPPRACPRIFTPARGRHRAWITPPRPLDALTDYHAETCMGLPARTPPGSRCGSAHARRDRRGRVPLGRARHGRAG